MKINVKIADLSESIGVKVSNVVNLSEEERKKYKDIIEQNEGRITILESELASAEKEYEQLENKLNQSQIDNQNLIQEIETKQSEINTLKQDIIRIQTVNSDLTSQLDKANQKIAELESEVDKAFIEGQKAAIDAENNVINSVYSKPLGDGTYGSPYLIYSVEQLEYFREVVNSGSENTHAELRRDIDLHGIEWTPIGLFSDDGKNNSPYGCIFNGNGHVIRNMHVYLRSNIEGGFFGRVNAGATIKNLGFVDSTVVSMSGVRIGVLAGELNYAHVENCYTAGNIYLYSDNIQKGGIAGESAGAYLKNCYTSHQVLTNGVPTEMVNCYSYTDETQSKYSSGELAFLLNESKNGGSVWYQTLNEDPYPTLNEYRGRVYRKEDETYSNIQE